MNKRFSGVAEKSARLAVLAGFRLMCVTISSNRLWQPVSPAQTARSPAARPNKCRQCDGEVVEAVADRAHHGTHHAVGTTGIAFGQHLGTHGVWAIADYEIAGDDAGCCSAPHRRCSWLWWMFLPDTGGFRRRS